MQLTFTVRGVDPLGPEVASVAANHLAAVKEQWMIVGGKPGEARFDRQSAHGSGDKINLGSIRESVTVPIHSQTPDQTNEARKENDDTDSSARRGRPAT